MRIDWRPHDQILRADQNFKNTFTVVD
jgi:hypothetical protein